jgi:hypothetical protein
LRPRRRARRRRDGGGVLAGRLETLGAENPAVARTRFNRACAKRDLGDLAAARELFTQATEPFRRSSADPSRRPLLDAQLVAIDLKLDDLDEAERLQRDLLEQTTGGARRAGPRRVAGVAAARVDLVARGETDEAAQFLRRAWDAAIVLKPRNSVLIREIKQEFVNLYTAAADPKRERVADPRGAAAARFLSAGAQGELRTVGREPSRRRGCLLHPARHLASSSSSSSRRST